MKNDQEQTAKRNWGTILAVVVMFLITLMSVVFSFIQMTQAEKTKALSKEQRSIAEQNVKKAKEQRLLLEMRVAQLQLEIDACTKKK